MPCGCFFGWQQSLNSQKYGSWSSVQFNLEPLRWVFRPLIYFVPSSIGTRPLRDGMYYYTPQFKPPLKFPTPSTVATIQANGPTTDSSHLNRLEMILRETEKMVKEAQKKTIIPSKSLLPATTPLPPSSLKQEPKNKKRKQRRLNPENEKKVDTWHPRFGHLSGMQRTIELQAADDISKSFAELRKSKKVCVSCIAGKQKRRSFKSGGEEKHDYEIGEVFTMDH